MASNDLTITDSHHHLWTPETHSWLKSADDPDNPLAIFRSVQKYLLPDFITDIEPYNLTKSVYVQSNRDGDPVDETKWVQTISDTNPKGFPHGIVGSCDLTSKDLPLILSKHIEFANFRGIRQGLMFHPAKPQLRFASHDNYLTDINWQQGYSLLSTHNLSFDMLVLPHQYTRVYDVIKANPAVPVVINHCGAMFDRNEDTMKLWRDGIAMLASLPNCYMKLSGLQSAQINPDDFALIKSIIQQLITLFGTDRCMYASNYPVDKIYATYKQVMNAFEFSIADYTLEEKKNIFAKNANIFYRL
ncbi:hypothetical protein LOD99_14804 [Oopsacas minuta]|uniref:Amidohydrolase-related domain-containing protein n=1 Tax=Oopsacas minuta TaxID=111878 RepID=A0AAV7KD26_9METZ|nr:hypothetical protein LOD99_14804 [Oopsacas minuta]